MDNSSARVGLACVIFSGIILHVSALSWTSCGSASDLIKLQKLSVSPDTVGLPGQITVSVTAKLLSNITGPVKVALKVSKKTLVGYIHIPCEDDIGSCTFNDVCEFSPYKDACPTVFDKYKLPCKCPIGKGLFEVINFPYFVAVHVPKFLVSGTFKVNVLMSMKDQQLGCYDIKLNLK